MLSSSEIARGNQGAIRFLWQDASAPFLFDNTWAACLRSFQVMILTAPLYVLIRFINYMDVEVAADIGLIVLVETLRYLVDWLLYPVLFYEIARWRGWLDRYPRYVAALNWTSLPQYVVLLVAASVSSLVPPLADALALAMQGLLIYWFLMVTRLALGASWLHASMLMIVAWAPSFILSDRIVKFLGITLPVTGG